MHTIEAVLYPNHLTTSGQGTYLAKNIKGAGMTAATRTP